MCAYQRYPVLTQPIGNDPGAVDYTDELAASHQAQVFIEDFNVTISQAGAFGSAATEVLPRLTLNTIPGDTVRF